MVRFILLFSLSHVLLSPISYHAHHTTQSIETEGELFLLTPFSPSTLSLAVPFFLS